MLSPSQIKFHSLLTVHNIREGGSNLLILEKIVKKTTEAINNILCKCSQKLLGYLGEFLIFLHESFLVAKSNQVLALNIKSLISTLDTLEMRLKVPILALFDDLGIFQAVSFGTTFSLGKKPIIKTMQTSFS